MENGTKNNNDGGVSNDGASKPEKKSEGYNAAQLVGTVLGPVAKVEAGVLPLVLEVIEREQDDGGNWQDVAYHFKVAITGTRAESLAKLELEGSRLFVDGVMRNGRTSGYVHARRVLLLGGKRRDDQARPTTSDVASRM